MSELTPYWMPKIDDESLMIVLAVPNLNQAEMTWERHQFLMIRKIKNLIEEAGEVRAKEALEMSVEHMPEMSQIAAMAEPRFWAESIMNSDTMMPILGQIDWSNPQGAVVSDISRELIEEESIESFIEIL